MQQLVLLLHNFLGGLFITEAHPCRENHHFAVVVSADVIEQYSRAAWLPSSVIISQPEITDKQGEAWQEHDLVWMHLQNVGL